MQWDPKQSWHSWLIGRIHPVKNVVNERRGYCMPETQVFYACYDLYFIIHSFVMCSWSQLLLGLPCSAVYDWPIMTYAFLLSEVIRKDYRSLTPAGFRIQSWLNAGFLTGAQQENEFIKSVTATETSSTHKNSNAWTEQPKSALLRVQQGQLNSTYQTVLALYQASADDPGEKRKCDKVGCAFCLAWTVARRHNCWNHASKTLGANYSPAFWKIMGWLQGSTVRSQAITAVIHVMTSEIIPILILIITQPFISLLSYFICTEKRIQILMVKN